MKDNLSFIGAICTTVTFLLVGIIHMERRIIKSSKLVSSVADPIALSQCNTMTATI